MIRVESKIKLWKSEKTWTEAVRKKLTSMNHCNGSSHIRYRWSVVEVKANQKSDQSEGRTIDMKEAVLQWPTLILQPGQLKPGQYKVKLQVRK